MSRVQGDHTPIGGPPPTGCPSEEYRASTSRFLATARRVFGGWECYALNKHTREHRTAGFNTMIKARDWCRAAVSGEPGYRLDHARIWEKETPDAPLI